MARLFVCSHKRSHASRLVYQLSPAYTGLLRHGAAYKLAIPRTDFPIPMALTFPAVGNRIRDYVQRSCDYPEHTRQEHPNNNADKRNEYGSVEINWDIHDWHENIDCQQLERCERAAVCPRNGPRLAIRETCAPLFMPARTTSGQSFRAVRTRWIDSPLAPLCWS